MKILIFIFFIPFFSFGQVDDHLKWQSEIDTANQIYVKANSFFHNTQWNQAYKTYLKATKIDSMFHHAYINAAIAAINNNSTHSILSAKKCILKAIQILDQKLQIEPNDRNLKSARIKSTKLIINIDNRF